MKRYDAGIQGEQEAENALTRQGMTMRTRRYRAEDGEIDLVMQDGETIVFVEVKARPQSRAGQGMLAGHTREAAANLPRGDALPAGKRLHGCSRALRRGGNHPRRADSCKKCVYGKHVKQKTNSERPISGVTR